MFPIHAPYRWSAHHHVLCAILPASCVWNVSVADSSTISNQEIKWGIFPPVLYNGSTTQCCSRATRARVSAGIKHCPCCVCALHRCWSWTISKARYKISDWFSTFKAATGFHSFMDDREMVASQSRCSDILKRSLFQGFCDIQDTLTSES